MQAGVEVFGIGNKRLPVAAEARRTHPDELMDTC